VAYSQDSRRALLWLVSAFGAVAFARHDAHLHPTATTPVLEAAAAPSENRQAAALRDGQRMDVNRASAAELELLPGVGPSLAKRLIEAREQRGPFRSLEELGRVRGMGAKTRQKLSKFLRFDSEQLEHTTQSELPLGHVKGLPVAPQEARAHVQPHGPGARGQVIDAKHDVPVRARVDASAGILHQP
jgi:competence ComEA-like helix-hairpin-helix protein